MDLGQHPWSALGRGTREKEKIKVRQPLSANCWWTANTKMIIDDLTPLIIEELNVKKVVFADELDQLYGLQL